MYWYYRIGITLLVLPNWYYLFKIYEIHYPVSRHDLSTFMNINDFLSNPYPSSYSESPWKFILAKNSYALKLVMLSQIQYFYVEGFCTILYL